VIQEGISNWETIDSKLGGYASEYTSYPNGIPLHTINEHMPRLFSAIIKGKK